MVPRRPVLIVTTFLDKKLSICVHLTIFVIVCHDLTNTDLEGELWFCVKLFLPWGQIPTGPNKRPPTVCAFFFSSLYLCPSLFL